MNQEFGQSFYFPQNLFVVLGDVNYDNFVNVVDLVAMTNWVLSNSFISIADINDDNILNVIDIVAVVNIILNL